ncbi:MAG: hypothetical protein EO766_11710 [Hydrotalea sp. AMD]|uniref:hypothetical protein n=1 Tax=Hydrotalea sp. AMD TaxID=2501297 RepID=UPI00102522BC|nr:hypothetical protein [Hydrotalea sp. AMD]RWZ87191.1 MAG: hypothetical protein EO766_11710 [Hydrotalea sp. AMD]
MSEILIEKIIVSPQIHDKIQTAILSWIEAAIPYVDNNLSSIDHNKKQITELLRRRLAPTITNIVKQYRQPIPDPEYMGHKVNVEVDILHAYSEAGSVRSSWTKYRDVPKMRTAYVYKNTLNITLSPYQISNIVLHKNENSIGELVSTITHEITHLIQSLSSRRNSVYNKNYYSTGADKDTRYYMAKFEIDAHAQSLASEILSKSKKMPDPIKYIQNILPLIGMGIQTVFNRPTFPSKHYQEIKNLLTSPSDDPKLAEAKKRAWRRFNKRIYEKLSNYLEHLQQK